jgi:hypothetical protein
VGRVPHNVPNGEPEKVPYIGNPFPDRDLLTVEEAISAIAQLSTAVEADMTVKSKTGDELEAIIERSWQGETEHYRDLQPEVRRSVRARSGIGRVRNTVVSRKSAVGHRRSR